MPEEEPVLLVWKVKYKNDIALWEEMRMNIDVIWKRICDHEGKTFRQIRGKEFTYTIIGNAVRLSTTNYNVGKGTFEKALQLMPLSNTVPIQDLPAPSYVYAILMDDRIRQNDY